MLEPPESFKYDLYKRENLEDWAISRQLLIQNFTLNLLRKPSETVRRTPKQFRLWVMRQSRLQRRKFWRLTKVSVVGNPRVAGSKPARPIFFRLVVTADLFFLTGDGCLPEILKVIK